MTQNTQQITGFVGKFQNYEKAIAKLREIFVLYKEEPINEIYQDSLIKKYEFTWELAWKTLKEYMNGMKSEKLSVQIQK